MVAGNGDQIRIGDHSGDQIMKDDAYMKFMHFILEVQVKNTYIYRYAFLIMLILIENNFRTMQIKAHTF